MYEESGELHDEKKNSEFFKRRRRTVKAMVAVRKGIEEKVLAYSFVDLAAPVIGLVEGGANTARDQGRLHVLEAQKTKREPCY
jgi:hypothetical protein